MQAGMQEQLGELRRFQAFLDTLKADLAHAQELRDRVLVEIQAYEELQANVKMLQQEQLVQLTTLVHLGCGVHARAHVPDASRLLVSVGLGFQLECTLEEALRVAALRLEHLQPLAEERSKRVAGIKAHAALVEQGLLGLGAPLNQAEQGLQLPHTERQGRWQ